MHSGSLRQRDGYAYYGIGFDASWDEEHGAGVMMHRTRVVEAGHADSAILEWIAEADAKATTKRRARGRKARKR